MPRKIQLPDPETLLLAARCELTVLRSADALDNVFPRVVELFLANVAGIEVAASDLDDLSAEQFAAAVEDPDVRFQVALDLLTAEFLCDPPNPALVKPVEQAAGVLGIPPRKLRAARDQVANHGTRIQFDLYRIGRLRDQFAIYDGLRIGEKLRRFSFDSVPWRLEDPELAAQYEKLRRCPAGSLGAAYTEFLDANEFSWPGTKGSLDSQTAKHDFAHVLADYTINPLGEVEVFTFWSATSEDPSNQILALVVLGLFQTGSVPDLEKIATANPHAVSGEAAVTRFVDAIRRATLCPTDLWTLDFFAHADRPVDEVRAELGIVPKSDAAVGAGSIGHLDFHYR